MRGWFVLSVLFLSGVAGAQEPPPPDAALIQSRTEALAAAFDSAPATKAAAWDEIVAAAFRIAQHREPTPEELFAIVSLHDHAALSPSQALALALRGPDGVLTWDELRDFLDRVEPDSIAVRTDDKSVAQKLTTAASSDEIRKKAADRLRAFSTNNSNAGWNEAFQLTTTPPHQIYQTYFGYLHAHTHLSDGTGTPQEAFAHARNEGKLDFFALTEHGELLLFWPWNHKWEEMVDAAEAAYEPGEFVTFWGFEWTNVLLGHCNVINGSHFVDILRLFWLEDFYNWLAEQPGVIATFNHPGDYDSIQQEFFRFARSDGATPKFVGIETWNMHKNFDTYFYANVWPGFQDATYPDIANANGWRIGPLGAEDNHFRKWGTEGQMRTGVLATELTREGILDAYRNRRFYSTEDKDLFLDFRCQGLPMGAVLAGGERTFTVSASDGGGDTFHQIRLFRNGELFDTRAVSGNPVLATFTDTGGAPGDYYYVIVTQNDGEPGALRNHEAISSPIWFLGAPPARGCGTNWTGKSTASMGGAGALLLAALFTAGLGHHRRS